MVKQIGDLGRILVTGGSGFVGKNLLGKLTNRKCELLVYSGGHKPPVQGIPTTTSFEDCKSFKPETVIHLSANASVVRSEQERSIADTQLTSDILKVCSDETRFIFLSSVLVSSNASLGIGKNNLVDYPDSFYGMNKLFSEALVRYYHKHHGLNYTIIRVPAIVGGGVTHGLMFDIVRKLKENEKLELLGEDPGSIKPFVHVNDLTDLLIHETEKGLFFNECYTRYCGPTDILSVRAVAEIAQDVLSTNKEVVFLGAQSNWSNDAKMIRMPKVCHRPPKSSKEAIREAFQEIASASFG